MDILSKSGIYRISISGTEYYYFGSAHVLKTRWNEHKLRLRKGSHHNPILQSLWNKYGEQSFVFEVVEFCEKEYICEREQIYLDEHIGRKGCANIAPKANSLVGFKHSPESIQKMRDAQKGRRVSLETRQKMSLAAKGKPKSETHKEKVRQTKRANPTRLSQEHLQVIAEKNSRIYRVTSPSGDTQVISNLAMFCRDNGLDGSTMVNVSKGKRKFHKGWLCEKIVGQIPLL